MAGYRGKQGAKPKASTIVERNRKAGRESSLKGVPKPPDHLNEAERAEWRRTGKLLRDAGLLDGLDKTLLAMYCTVYVRWAEAEDMVKKHGPIWIMKRKAKDGESEKPEPYPMQSPYLSVANKALQQMNSMLGELGMTPAARSRIPKSESREQKPQRKYQSYKADPRELLEALN